MSQKPLLILVHGMGNHTAQSFKTEVVNACNNALQRYPTFKDIDFATQVHIESIAYNDCFEQIRQQYVQSGKELSAFISGGMAGPALPDFVADLAKVQAKLGDDEFLYTHVLDVLFYISLVGEKVRLSVAEQFVTAVKKYPAGTKINVMAHSLGNAVMHDTLNKLYSDGYKNATGQLQKNNEGHDIHLDPFTLPVDMYWSIANVSGIITKLSGLTGPLDSIVKPGGEGCVGAFLNVFHEFDPFTLKILKRFDPKESDNWVDPASFQMFYKKYMTAKVARMNTHRIGGYLDAPETGGFLEDPLVCHDFLSSLMSFNPEGQEKIDGDAAYKNVQDEAKKIKQQIDEIDGLDDESDLVKLVIMLKTFKDFVGSL